MGYRSEQKHMNNVAMLKKREDGDLIQHKAKAKAEAITMMGHVSLTHDNQHNFKGDTSRINEKSDNDPLLEKEGMTLLGQTGILPMIEYKEEDLYIGNLHKQCEISYYHNKEAHNWTMFISSSKDKLVKPTSIKQVTYYLHETFRPSREIITKSPFTLKKRGWGWFLIKAKIEFLDEYNRKDLYCSHMLDFDHSVAMTHINKYNTMDTGKQMKGKDMINDMMINVEIYDTDHVETHYSPKFNDFIDTK